MPSESTHRTHVTTFYSFKGGVGRTLLLANVGASLAAQGRKVLLWDLDVEAPGIHNIPSLKPAEAFDGGFLEWLRDWQNGSRQLPLTEAQRKSLAGLVRRVPGLPGLSILPACGQSTDWAQIYQEIDWHSLFVTTPDLGLGVLRGALAHLCQVGQYDHLLIDSRTGLTDLGGNLVAALPHASVLVGSYGHQNTAGLLRIKQALEPATTGRLLERGPDAPPLALVLVASPVPTGEESAAELRRKVWEDLFKTRAAVEVPWDPRLLFEEQLLAITDRESRTGAAYIVLAEQLTTLRRQYLAALDQIEHDHALGSAAHDDDEHAFGLRDDPRRRRARGLSFEERVQRLLVLLGFDVEAEQDLGGNKVDLVARKRGPFQDEVYWVECKDHQAGTGKDVLEKLEGWTRGEAAQRQRARGMVVARRFSPQALGYAKDHPALVAVTAEELEARLIDLRPYLSNLRRAFEASELARTYVGQRALIESAPQDQEGVALLEHGMAWAAGDGRRLWLLLGDYGTGKSCYFKKLAYELAVKAEEDPAQPIPIAIDLKKYPNAISLTSLLQEHLRAESNWHGNPDILLHLLSAGRVVLLLDAFDEMGVAAAGRSVEEQFRQLAFVAGDEPIEIRGNRVLITCRTHFFRDQQQVKDTAEGRIGEASASGDSSLGRLARRFDAAIDEMLLFKDEQIREYLTLHLGQAHAQDALAFIQQTYDLGRLAPRPVLLELIVKALPKLAADRDTVTAADLYRHYTDLWLEDRAGGTLRG
jgi:Mrp family chromosome partitioning ATPase